jgi:endonuclease V-like protein UPF0215 family
MVSGNCSVCGESSELRAGMCVPHYGANWRDKMASVKCKVDGCKSSVKVRMMCDKHYRKVRNQEALEKELTNKDAQRRALEMVDGIKLDERRRIIQILKSAGMLDAAMLLANGTQQRRI